MIRRVVPEDFGDGAIRAAYLAMRDQPLTFVKGNEITITPGVCGATVRWMKGERELPYRDRVVEIKKSGGEVVITWSGGEKVRSGVLRNALECANAMNVAHARLYGLDERCVHRYASVGAAMNESVHLAVWDDEGRSFEVYELGEDSGRYAVDETLVVQGNGLLRHHYTARHVEGGEFDVSEIMRERNAFERYSYRDGGLVAPVGWRVMDYIR